MTGYIRVRVQNSKNVIMFIHYPVEENDECYIIDTLLDISKMCKSNGYKIVSIDVECKNPEMALCTMM